MLQRSRGQYYPALDGARAIAVLLVFLHHYIFYLRPELRFNFWLGWTGVDFFFVLSGFLITGILYDSRHLKHRYRDFYMRRVLRILPLYYAVMAVGALLLILKLYSFHLQLLLWPLHLGNYARYVSTTDVDHLYPTVKGAHSIISMGHFWTLCLEEQFYFLWPWLIWKARSYRACLISCCIAIAVAIVTRIALLFYASPWHVNQEITSRLLITRMDALALGGVLAILLRGPSEKLIERWRSKISAILIAPLVLYISWQIATHRAVLGFGRVNTIAGFTIVDLASVGIIITLINDTSVFSRILQFRWLRFLGTISYGFYVFHDLPHTFYLGIAERTFPTHVLPAVLLLGFTSTLALSSISYWLLEKPFLRLKKRFPAQIHTAPARQDAEVAT